MVRFLVTALCALAAAQMSMPPPFADRLSTATFSLGDDIDALYQAEYSRLQRVCAKRGDPKCPAANLREVRRQVAVLRLAPDPGAPIVATLHAHLHLAAEHGLGFDIEAVWTSAPGAPRTWLDMKAIADWGYGIHVAGVRDGGAWMQLFDPALPPVSWIDTREPQFAGQAEPIAGQLLTLAPLRAASSGRTAVIERGVYLIERVAEGDVHFRSTVPSDMPCGEPPASPEAAPGAMPPTWRAAAAELFAPDGSPRFSKAYPRGC